VKRKVVPPAALVAAPRHRHALDDRAADRQADPQPLRLGRDEWLEQPYGDLGRDARAGVGDADRNHPVGVALGGERQLPPSAALRGFDALRNQVDNDLLQLDAVDQRLGQLRGDLQLDPDVAVLDPDQGERARLLDQLGDRFAAPIALAFSDEIAQPANDLRRPHNLGRGAVEDAARPLDAGRIAARQQPPPGLEIIRRRGQRLVDLMGERRGHLAHLGQARDMRQLALQVLQPVERLLPLGQIAQKAGEEPMPRPNAPGIRRRAAVPR
jgi:hypothetical protein